MSTPDRGPWIQTRSGARFYPFSPDHREVDLYDVAHALAYKCRYNGHTSAFYSVAEHSVRCAWLLHKTDTTLALCGLLHDAHEAYTGDMPQPLKHGPGMDAFRAMEEACERVVAVRFGLPWPYSPMVKWADRVLLHTEARDLMQPIDEGWRQWLTEPAMPEPIEPWNAEEAMELFLREYGKLEGERAVLESAEQILRESDD